MDLSTFEDLMVHKDQGNLTPEDFTNYVTGKMTDSRPEIMDQADLCYMDTVKNNGVTMFGFTVRVEGGIGGGMQMSPCIYLNDMYDSFMNGDLSESELDDRIDIYAVKTERLIENNEEMKLQSENGFQLPTYEKIRTSVYPKVINYDKNREFLENVPHFKLGDLACVFYIKNPFGALYGGKFPPDAPGHDPGMRSSTVITHKLLETFEADLSMIREDVVNNAVKDVNVSSIFKMIGYPMDDPQVVESGPFVVTNNDLYFGACGIIPEVLQKAAEQLGSDLIVMPSSIHELVVVRKDAGDEEFDLRALKEMVTEINATVVEATERLSDNVYEYDLSRQELSLNGEVIDLVLPDGEKEGPFANKDTARGELKDLGMGNGKKPSILSKIGDNQKIIAERNNDPSANAPELQATKRTSR